MIWWVNLVSNAIVLAVCLWAVLNQRVETKIVGTISLSSLGIFAAMNLLMLGELSWQGGGSQAMANASVACLLTWVFLRYQRYLRAAASRTEASAGPRLRMGHGFAAGQSSRSEKD